MIGFALVGCGRIAQRYGEILGGGLVSGARLAAACDIRPDRAAAFAARYRVPVYDEMHRMLAARGAEIDAICILSESGNHARHCLELASYGRTLVIEKPMALSVEDADAMIEACERRGVRLCVVKQNRYNLPVRALRKALEAGRFGKLVMGTVRVRWSRDQQYYDQDAWRGTWAMDGGVFANQASHHIDLLEWMLGEPESVYAYSRTALVDIETEDTGIAVIRFRNGALGIIEATTATRPKDLEGSLSILGEKGTVEIGGFAVNELKTWNFCEPQPDDAETLASCHENPPNVYGFGHIRYLQHVVDDVIIGGGASLIDGAEGRKSLEMITALYQSIATRREVQLKRWPERSVVAKVGSSVHWR